MKKVIIIQIKLLFVVVFIILKCSSPQAQDRPSHLYNLKNGVAIQGYDPVSYFENDKPLKGDKNINAELRGATYFFANQENLKKFKSNPDAYEPEYGGWCAFAIGLDGSKVKINPTTYKILDGKLYLFYNFNLTNTLKKWSKNEKELKMNADKYWSEIVNN